MSTKYSNAVFLKVDVDKCADTAANQGVSAMPTFIFYRNRVKLDLCQGADPNRLESKIQNFYGLGDTDESEGSVSGHVHPLYKLYHGLRLITIFIIIFARSFIKYVTNWLKRFDPSLFLVT